MNHQHAAIVPPAPKVHATDLATVPLLLASARSTLAIWPQYMFEVPVARRTLLGRETVLLNDPAAIRYVLAENAGNYVRPTLAARLFRPLLGRGVILSEGGEWRRQRRMLAPPFTPNSVGLLLPHFAAAAGDLARNLEGLPRADLSAAFQNATLEAVLRALFSMPDSAQREQLGDLVRRYMAGPGRLRVFDSLARGETDFSFALRTRRAFQKVWFAAVDKIVAERTADPRDGVHRDLLDMLLAVRDAETGEPLSPAEVRDQCATMITAGYETTARLLFWASYLLTLDAAEQERLRAEIRAFPPDRVVSLADLAHWPRLRLVLLEALRLYPPVAHLVREPIADDVIQGKPVRPGAQVWVSAWVLHRHRAHWTNPTAFVPDRFANVASPWVSLGTYLPFGGGPRICLGASFAMAEAEIMMAALLMRYRISGDGGPPVVPIGRLTIEPSRAPMFRMERV